MLIQNATYDSHTIVVDADGPISIFENVRIQNNPLSNDFVFICGTYVPITCTPHYFHFLKEYYGFYIYYKNKYDHDAKYLWIEHDYFYPSYQNMDSVCRHCYDQISDGIVLKNFPGVNLHIEKLVILFDSQKCITGATYEQPSYLYTPGINSELRKDILPMMRRSHHGKKIYLSRKIVSEDLPNHPVRPGHESLKKWKSEQIRLRYVDPELEERVEAEYSANGYEILQLSGMDILEQAYIFNNAEKVAGPLGTAFYNGIFSSEKTNFEGLKLNKNYHYSFDVDVRTVLPNASFEYREIY
jgi:hypothetical protein